MKFNFSECCLLIEERLVWEIEGLWVFLCIATAVAMIETAAVQLGRKFYHHVSIPLDMVGDEQARWSKLVMHQLPRLSNEGAWVVIEHLHLVANWHQKLQSLLQVSSCTACMYVVYIWAMYTILEPVYVYMHIVTCKLYPSMHVYTYITPYINAHRAETVLLYCQHLWSLPSSHSWSSL